MSNYKKCLNCEYIPCANLHSKSAELDGGELYVLNESIKQKKIVPCQSMALLYSCCMLCKAAFKELNTENNKIEDEGELVDVPLLELIWQCTYDLKTSAFLAISAHYRGAIQLLRPVMESVLVGLYFEERLREASNSEDEIHQVWIDFDTWREGDYKLDGKDIDFKNIKRWLEKKKVITDEGKERIGRLWGELGKKYIHPYFCYMDIGGEKCSKCPATTRYDEDRYYEWLEFFQNIIDLVIGTLLRYYPAIVGTADTREALGYLKNLESLETELGMPMIKSEYLKDRIARLPTIYESFKSEQ